MSEPHTYEVRAWNPGKQEWFTFYKGENGQSAKTAYGIVLARAPKDVPVQLLDLTTKTVIFG